MIQAETKKEERERTQTEGKLEEQTKKEKRKKNIKRKTNENKRRWGIIFIVIFLLTHATFRLCAK